MQGDLFVAYRNRFCVYDSATVKQCPKGVLLHDLPAALALRFNALSVKSR
jgi:hypothetical protein